jgi:hypothetical protein
VDLHFGCRHERRARIRWRPPPGLLTFSLACTLLLLSASSPAKEIFRGTDFGFVHSDGTIGVGSYTEADYSHGDPTQAYLGTMVFANVFGSGAAEAGYRIIFDVPTARTIRFRAALYRQSAALTYGSAAFAGNSAFWVVNGNRDTKQIDAWLTAERCAEIAIAMAETAVGVEATTVRQAIRELAEETYKENLQDIFEGLFEQGEADSIIIDRTFEATAGTNEIIVGVRSQASGVAWDSARAFVHAHLREIAVWGIGVPESPQIEGPAIGCPNADYEFAAYHDFPRIGTGNLDYSYRFVWGDGTSTGWSDYVPCGTPVIETHRFPAAGTYKVVARTKDALDPTEVAADSLLITIGSHAPDGRPLVYASSAADCDTVQVRWTPVRGAINYRLYRDGLDEGDVIYEGPNLSHPDLPPYRPTYPEYAYHVRAYNACGNTRSVYPAYGHRQMPPEAPPAVTATDYDSCTVVVNWTPVDSLLVAGSGFPVGIADSYSIWRSASTNPMTAVQIGVSEGCTHCTTYRDTPPLANVYYRYWVKAHNACGASPLSGSYGSGLLPPSPPQPTGVTASDGTSCSVVTIEWDRVAGPWQYYVHRSGVRISGARYDSYDDTTAAPGQTYDYTVLACRNCDSTQCIASAPDQGNRATPPGAPAGVAATDGLCDQVQVSWSAVPTATSYNVYRDGVLIGTDSASPYVDDEFTPLVNHAYTVQACSGSGCGCGPLSAANTGSGRRKPTGMPGFVSASDHVCGPITVTWGAVPLATTYEITRSGAPLATVTITSHIDNTVAPGQSYSYSIRARNDCGSSTQSAADYGSTRSYLTNGPVLTASDGANCQVDLSWTAVPTAEHYSLWRQDMVTEVVDTLQTVWNSTDYTDHPPLYGPRYRYLARAHACNEVDGNWDPGHAYAPTITLRDVPGDSGGQLFVVWSTFPRCPSDLRGSVTEYVAQRRDDRDGAEWAPLGSVIASMDEFLELEVATADICSPDGRQQRGVYRVATIIGEVPFYSPEIIGCSFDNLTSPAPTAVTRHFRDVTHGNVPGLAAVDTVYVLGGPQRTDGDFESATGPDSEGWTGQDLSTPGLAGSFGAIRPDLGSRDQDRCADNQTPALAFVDDGVVVPGSPASCVTWCYGPGEHVVNPNGGLSGPDTHLDNMFVSPPLAWPAGHPGAVLRYDLYRHEELDPSASPGLFCRWKVRSSLDGGLTWGLWQDRGLAYFGGPDWTTFAEDVSDLLDPFRTTVQIALGVQELGWIWGMNGTDATPAPYYDNVALLAYAAGGPVIAARAVDLAQDAFPASGFLDLNDLASNDVRCDMARDISAVGALNPWPGDSLAVWSAPAREGAIPMPPLLRYRLRPNPLFGAGCRTSGRPNSGVFTGEVCLRDGSPVPNRWYFNLPDEGFLFPGDVMHYYFVARDNLDGNIAQSRLPADTTGFSCFHDALGSPPPLRSRPRYPELFTLRALPSLASATPGDQPPILLWLDGDEADIGDEWLTALDNLGYREGADYDLYVTNGPSSGVGNGLGARATAQTIQDYRTILYDCGDERVMTLSGNDGGLNRGDDLALLDAWLKSCGRNLLAAGNHLVSDLADRTTGQTFLSDWLGVTLDADDARPLLGSQGAARVSPVQGNSVFDEQLTWIANGNCPRAQGLDAFTATGPTERLAAYLSPAGQPYSFAAAARRYSSEFDADVLLLGCSLGQAWPNVSGLPAADPFPLTVQAKVLGRILMAFGALPASPAPTSVTPPSAGVFTCRACPNPFNPRVLFTYDMPAAGRLAIGIYDLRGRLVRRLVAGEVPAGRGELVWDGTDDVGAPVASGAYYARSTAQGRNLLGKLMLVR